MVLANRKVRFICKVSKEIFQNSGTNAPGSLGKGALTCYCQGTMKGDHRIYIISTPTGSYGSMTIPLCTPKSSIYRWNFPHKPSIWGVPPFMENPHISSHVLSTAQSSGHRFSAFKSSGFVRHTIRNTKPGSSIKGE